MITERGCRHIALCLKEGGKEGDKDTREREREMKEEGMGGVLECHFRHVIIS